ncbi:MAG: alpha,alpha-trehalose-phosphate synthase (UDP-forming) [Proteobacteria bacterium]|nr:alpha,alpha-trehalose-phosphate synthase (UDP-forming) [Pseudomonadota bacterium]
MSRLIVVSNRVAPIKGKTSAGGLAVAVLSALRESGGIWFGWSGEVVQTAAVEPTVVKVGRITYALADLTSDDHNEYYNGFANRTLWPLFHYRLDLTAFDRRCFDGYLRVNDRLARQLVPLVGEDDLIWVHDYHLIPFGEALARHGCRAPVGFFLHIPFPASEVLVALPYHQELLRTLFAYDLVGFQTDGDLRAFHDYVEREVGGSVDPDGTVRAFGRTTRAGTFPIGIDTDDFAALPAKAEVQRQIKRLKSSMGDRQLVIGVDRLDYTKGLVERLQAFEQMLETYPAMRGAVSLLQIAPPTRGEVPEYADIRRALEAVAGHINGRFAEFDWVPIRYLNKSFSRRALAGLFRGSRVGMVTPLRDGMNLVAKEYVAAQDPDDPGVLVLSQFSGAARQLDAALIVNPYDSVGVAESLHLALTMPIEERIERWAALMEGLRRDDVAAWRNTYLDALRRYSAAA